MLEEEASADRLHKLARSSQQERQSRGNDAHSPFFEDRMIFELRMK